MNYQINVENMRRKTEVENNLLNQVEIDLRECVDLLDNIYKNYKIISNPSSNFNSNSDSVLNTNKFVSFDYVVNSKQFDVKTKNKFVSKLFAHVNQTYWAFQYFYLKKKDFMGMNLTGLVNGKVETGLGFRKCLEIINPNIIKTKYIGIIQDYDLNNLNNIRIYKIKSDAFDWIEFDLNNYSNFYVIEILDKKEYFIIFDTNK